MSPVVRFARFNVVGALGIGVQLVIVGALVHGLGVGPVLATAAGIIAALLHNFIWHVRWTWRDRMGLGVSRVAAFLRFAGANGVVSLVGSMLLMPVLTGSAGLPAIPANLVAIAVCGLLNYWMTGFVFAKNRYRVSVFAKSPARPGPEQRPSAARV